MSDADLFRFIPGKKTIMYTYIKKPITNGAKVIKIEVYDAEKFPTPDENAGSKILCDCEAELCVQHVVKNPFMDELAARGCDIVLVSRSLDKLKATAAELEKDFGVSTRIIQVDFCEDESIYDRIQTEISGLEIGTLVNNVGISYTYPEYFLDLPDWDKTISNLIRANMVAVTKMTKMVLPAMVERKKGVIINLGSASSIIPSPLLTVYAATKAYLDKFTEGVDMEYSKHGIIVQCVLPGFVCSNMSGIRRKTLLTPTAQEFVKSSIGLVGTEAKTTGYLPHAAFVNVLNGIQAASKTFATWVVTRTMETSRRKALKKYKKQ